MIPHRSTRPSVHWVTAPFLVIPAQLMLAIAAAGALRTSSTRSTKRIGAVIAIGVWILILGHIAITVSTL